MMDWFAWGARILTRSDIGHVAGLYAVPSGYVRSNKADEPDVTVTDFTTVEAMSKILR